MINESLELLYDGLTLFAVDCATHSRGDRGRA